MGELKNSTRVGRLRVLAVLAGIFLVAAVFMMARPATARDVKAPTVSDSTCLGCHGKPGLTKTLPSGEVLLLTIDAGHFANTVHAEEGLACQDCHLDITGFPHQDFPARTLREVSLQLYTICQKCHVAQYDKTLDSIHQKQLAAGNFNAAICTDCHNPHVQKRITDPVTGALLPDARLQIPKTCARCHSVIYQTYKDSIHGSALTDYNNLEVPTCINCHGVHNIQDPTTQSFRNNSPLLCARCHTDAAIMSKYNISTQVLNTYVADFHGTTITLFEEAGSDKPSNKPVCYDCHGVHDIKRVDDPDYGIAMKKNLLVKCQVCHPDANANFPSAWMSHYIPNKQVYPLVYYINLFYKFFIPTVLGGMAVFVLSDAIHRLVTRIKGGSH